MKQAKGACLGHERENLHLLERAAALGSFQPLMAVGSPPIVTSGWSKPHSWPWNACAPLLQIHDGGEKLHYKGGLHCDNKDEGTLQTVQIDWSVGQGGRRKVAQDERAGRM